MIFDPQNNPIEEDMGKGTQDPDVNDWPSLPDRIV